MNSLIKALTGEAPPCIFGMEACLSAHFVAPAKSALGRLREKVGGCRRGAALIQSGPGDWGAADDGERRIGQEALFYEFSLERHVPGTHLLRSIERFVQLEGLRRDLAPFYSAIGRPSVDPELMIRMLIVGYCIGIRSERRLCA